MKKVFAILAIASVMTACNNDSEKKETTTDSTKMESPLMDAANTQDSVNKMMDSTHKMMDSTKKLMDSTNKK